VSNYEEAVLAAGTDRQVEEKVTTVPDRSLVARTNVSPKPDGLWGVRAWVWEFRAPVERGSDGVVRHDLMVDVRDGATGDADSSNQQSDRLTLGLG
jgi:hypothetical protein